MDQEFLEQVKSLLMDLEGFETRPYFDSELYVSFGIGHNLHANPLTDKQREYGKTVGSHSIDFVYYLFNEDIGMVHQAITDRFDWILLLPPNQRLALYTIMFQMGEEGFSEFEPTWRHLRAGELDEVKRHLEASKWAKQTPKRAARIIKLLIEGKDK